MIGSRLTVQARNKLWMAIQRSSHDHGHQYQVIGDNLPFSIKNHRVLAIKMTIFLAIPFGLPFLCVRHQLKKASGA